MQIQGGIKESSVFMIKRGVSHGVLADNKTQLVTLWWMLYKRPRPYPVSTIGTYGILKKVHFLREEFW